MAARRRPLPTVAPEDEAYLPPIAEALLRWPGARLFGATDVLIWPTVQRAGIADGTHHIRISFKGPALAIERAYAKEMLPNHNLYTEITLQRELGFEPQAEGERGRVYGIKSEVGRQLDEPDAPYEEILRVVGEYAGVALEKRYGAGVAVDVNLMPLEGAPLEPYYSAKKKAWQPAGTPPPTLRGGEGTPRADLCRMYTRVTSCSRDVVAIPQRSSPSDYHSFFTRVVKNSDFMVAHSTMPVPESAKLVSECGGWIFPSFGVGMVPSVTFGPLCLFASVDLVLSGLSPYKKRGAWPINVYDTDVWSMRSRHLEKASQILYQQLTGTYDEDSANRYGAMDGGGAHQWILGAPTSLSTFGPSEDEVKLLTTTSALARELAERWKIWAYSDDMGRTVSSSKILDRYASTRHRYPYLEAKANSLVDASCWQVAVCPRTWARKSRAYMKATGITADLLLVPDPPSVAKHGTEHWSLHGVGIDVDETHRYSQAVAKAVVAFAEREGRVRSYAL